MDQIPVNESLNRFLVDLFASSPLNRLPESFGRGPVYARPLVGVARGDDPIFHKFKNVVSPDHLTPPEAWTLSGHPADETTPSRLRIASIIFPYSHAIREAGNANAAAVPPEIYCVGRNFADRFIDSVLAETENFLRTRGFGAVAPVRADFFSLSTCANPFRLCSNWSERHVAFAAGLGTFSLHEGFITEVGCNVRIGSVITNAPLEVTPRASDDPYANCLYLAKGECGKCISKCPAGAVTKDGHDKRLCREYLRTVGDEMERRPLVTLLIPADRTHDGHARTRYPVGCALCQFGVPCTSANPMTAHAPPRA